jgi:hypothetical protein
MNASPDMQRPHGREDVVFRQLDDDWVVFDPVADRLHALNLTAALVWSHCSGALDVSEIAEAVGAAFTPPVSATLIRSDVEGAIARFRKEGLLA